VIVLVAAGLPLLMVPAALALRRVSAAAAALATLVALVVAGALAASQAQAAPLVILGRSIGLTPLTGGAFAFSCALLAMVVLHTVAVPVDHTAYALMLVAMALFGGTLAIRNPAIGGMLLEIGAIVATLLMVLRRGDLAMEGMRSLVVVGLLLPLILMASGVLGTRTSIVVGESPPSGLLALAGMLVVALGLVPFHVWLMPVYRRGPGLSIVMLTVVMGIVVLAFAASALGWPELPQRIGVFSTVLLVAGLASAILGGLGALGQRTFGRVLAFGALADMGVVLVGLGLGGPTDMAAALLHAVYRGLGVTAAAIALDVFRERLGGDDEHHLRGALRKAPLTVLGMSLAAFSLSGLPLMAGFGTRLLIYTSLAQENPTWAVLAVVASVGPLWAFGRAMRAAFAPLRYQGEEREPRISGGLVLFVGLLLLMWGVFPQAVPFAPVEWLSAHLGGM